MLNVEQERNVWKWSEYINRQGRKWEIVFLKNDLNEMESIKGQQTDKYTIQEIFFVEFFRF